jgi:hypothetical protein
VHDKAAAQSDRKKAATSLGFLFGFKQTIIFIRVRYDHPPSEEERRSKA